MAIEGESNLEIAMHNLAQMKKTYGGQYLAHDLQCVTFERHKSAQTCTFTVSASL
jgi:hypothetical protein